MQEDIGAQDIGSARIRVTADVEQLRTDINQALGEFERQMQETTGRLADRFGEAILEKVGGAAPKTFEVELPDGRGSRQVSVPNPPGLLEDILDELKAIREFLENQSRER